MNVRQAILKTAALFEREPGLFDFVKTRVPRCGTPGCALGYILAFLGAREGTCLYDGKKLFGTDSRDFYDRMSALNGNERPDWMNHAAECARCLRLYADKYFPASAIPAEVRRIFELADIPEEAS